MTKVKSKLLAFSMIELLIVIAIIGIISAIGAPSYVEYVRKTKIKLAYQDAKAAQTKLTAIYAKSGSLTKVNSKSYQNSAERTYDFLNPSSEYVSSIVITNGVINITVDSNKVGISGDANIYLSLSSDGIWVCSASSILLPFLINCEATAGGE
jgi:type IV pilus assembly protein PilA